MSAKETSTVVVTWVPVQMNMVSIRASVTMVTLERDWNAILSLVQQSDNRPV